MNWGICNNRGIVSDFRILVKTKKFDINPPDVHAPDKKKVQGHRRAPRVMELLPPAGDLEQPLGLAEQRMILLNNHSHIDNLLHCAKWILDGRGREHEEQEGTEFIISTVQNGF
jgi:hypothetical protein